jgi:hypothetical protein
MSTDGRREAGLPGRREVPPREHGTPADTAGRFPFFARTWAGLAPLLLWALHFAICYVGVAIGCSAIARGAPLGAMPLRVLLAAGTAAAVLVGAGLVWRGCRAMSARQGDLLPKVQLVGSGLAVVAILWTGVPLAMLPLCGAG